MKHHVASGLWGAALLTLVLAAAAPAAEPADASPLVAAHRLLEQGKYAEAEEAYQALSADHGREAAIGLARSREASGHRDEAAKALQAAAEKHPKASALSAELARLALARGDLDQARTLADETLRRDDQSLPARWVLAEVLAARGELTQADAQYGRLVAYYNEHQPRDPESLRWIGLAAAEYARWNRLSDQFGFLVNEFYPDLLTLDPTNWRAHYEAGRLFAEKYNQADAMREWNAALALNPNAAEVHVGLGHLALDRFEIDAANASAERALEINPELIAARHLKADIALANFDPRGAAGVLTDSLKLHPDDEATLGRLAAAYASVDGVTETGPETRFGKLVAQVTARNPHAGRFYEALADGLDRLRRWPAAAQYYQQAAEQMPQLIRPPGQLGMMLMRLGDEDRARKILNDAFQADPFNVRVNNTLKVLEVLDGYETLETEHFRVRFDPKQDALVAQYMGKWLEEVYPQLVEQMGYEPPEKSLFEVFSRAKNTGGHGWFSARMVGLPHIHPIGACAGKIVALTSPNEGERQFNWARVLKHEFVHVINLQQTDFNIPHWFTEALAVLNEGYPRPQSWNDLLAKAFADERLFDLDTINFGFIRPHSSAEWTLAYCQAELYAEYMLDRFGDDAIAKMLAAYADNLTTPEAIPRALGVQLPDFETGYKQFVADVVATLPAAATTPEMNLLELKKALVEKPDDPELLAQLAYEQLRRRNFAQARRAADQALSADVGSGLAHYVRARLHLLVGENSAALERLEEALDREHPQPNLLSLLAGLKLKSEDFAAAADLYALGAKHAPGDPKWLKALAAVHLKSGNNAELAAVLEQLALLDADNFPIRKKLAQLARAADDVDAVQRWTREALHINVRDVDIHVWRAEALLAQKSPGPAADEYAAAITLEPDRAELRLALAEAYIQAERADDAKAVLDALLEKDPQNTAAANLLKRLR